MNDRLVYTRAKFTATICAEKWSVDGLGYELGSKQNKQDGIEIVAEFVLQPGEIDLSIEELKQRYPLK